MKSKEELNALKNEVETLNKKLAELNDEELAQVSGGDWGVQEYETFLSKSENGGGESSVVGFHPGYVEFP